MRAGLKKPGGTYSVSTWFWNGLAPGARPVTGYLVSRGEDGADGAPGDHLGIGGTAGPRGRLFFFNGNRLNGGVGGRTEIPPGTWDHAVSVRAGRKVAAYLNGSAGPEPAGEAEAGRPPGVTQFFFGGRSDNFANLEGRLDEIAAYDRALRADEAAATYRAAGGRARGGRAGPAVICAG